MPRTAIVPQAITIAGLTPSYAAANADGYSLANNGRQALHVKNGGGSPITVTVVTSIDVGGRSVPDDQITIPNGAERIIGPFDTTVHNQKTGDDRGKVHINFSGVTSVTVAALTLA